MKAEWMYIEGRLHDLASLQGISTIQKKCELVAALTQTRIES